MRFWSLILQIFSGILVIHKKRSDLPKNTPYVVCCNHASYFDIVLMYRVFSDYFVMMGKGEIKNWPLFNVFFTSGMNILVNRGKNIDAHKSFEEAKQKISQGQNVVVFPEATIPNEAPFIKSFKNGAFKLAIEKQVPIVPITFETNWKLMQGTVILKGMAGPGLCKVHIHEPISTVGMTEKDVMILKTKVLDIIKQPLEQHYERLDIDAKGRVYLKN
jgi:1-acyl-sn-glycerol-3-phosphate acyltransferase